MAKVKLHDVIADVLRNAGNPLNVTEIVEIIRAGQLWLRPSDQMPPAYNQIWARIMHYPRIFAWQDGYVSLQNLNLEQRMFRLTWNTKGWELPVKHDWDPADQGKSDVAFENQYGFGGEEWLFNSRYFQDGYQYGYIRGAKELSPAVTIVHVAYLFTIHQESGDRFLVGKINDLEIIHEGDPAEATAELLYINHLDKFTDEIEMAEGDPTAILVEGFRANVRFRLTGNELFETPGLVPGLRGQQYNRFKPYKVKPELQALLNGHIPRRAFSFSPGVASTANGYERHTSATQASVRRQHSEITKALEKYLKPDFSVRKNNISIEKTPFGANIADVVLQHEKNVITILEVKTTMIARKNIREAIGQLLDYALWFDDITIRKLVIVAPSPLNPEEVAYFKRLQNQLKFKLSYWQYKENTIRNQPKIVELL